ncbi:MAG: hypothetical protein MJ072_00100 [Clostridia bacterium]|nr:hypothetical protein [Clostridia bacterium]
MDNEQNINEASVTPKVVQTGNRKCPNCGYNLVFDPEKQDLHCEQCDSHFTIPPNDNVRELNLAEGMNEEESWTGGMKTFTCANCGAQVVLDKTETASVCPFCGTGHVVDKGEFRGLKPTAVVPFALTPKQANESLAKWAKSRILAPSAFHKSFKECNLKGVYMPAFTFDSNTYSTYSGRIGIRHTRRVGSGKDARTETWTEWKYISGSYNKDFDDVLVTAGSNLTQKELTKIGNYSSENNKIYSDEYLYGYSAFVKERTVDSCWKDAKVIMDGEIKRGILSRYHYDFVDYLNVSTTHERPKYKYVLFPVYIGSYSTGKKSYHYVANGVTGKSYGKVPHSPIRVSIAVTIGLALLALILYFLCKA